MSTAVSPTTITVTAQTAATVPRGPHERNAPCPCGSGKKYKRCHYLVDHEASRQAEIARRAQWAREAEQARAERAERLQSYGRDDNGRTRGGRALLSLALMAAAVNK